MTLDAAQRFVIKMREDRQFRKKADTAAKNQKTTELMQEHHMDINLHELVRAMAACMDEMSENI